MKRIRQLILPALMAPLLLALLPAACGNDSGPTGVEGNLVTVGTLTLGLDGSNIPIDSTNSERAFDLLIAPVYETFNKGHADLAVGTLLAAVTDLEGRVSGHVEVSGTVSSNQSPTTFDFTATFHDFSNDAKLYLGGRLRYAGSIAFNAQTGQFGTILNISGDGLGFTGTYRGNIRFNNLRIYADRDGIDQYNGAVVFIPAGQSPQFTLTLTPPPGPGGPGGPPDGTDE